MSRANNGAHFIGNLTRDPELTKVGEYSKCTFSIAVQRQKAGADGVRKADFIPIETWRSLADNCGKYLTKGRRVAVDCHVQTNSWEGEDGKKRFSIAFVADDVEFQPMNRGNDNAQSGTAGYHSPDVSSGASAGGGYLQVDEEELPF